MKPKKLDSFCFFICLTITLLLLAILSVGFIYYDWNKSHRIDAGQIILVIACLFGTYVCFLWSIKLRKK